MAQHLLQLWSVAISQLNCVVFRGTQGHLGIDIEAVLHEPRWASRNHRATVGQGPAILQSISLDDQPKEVQASCSEREMIHFKARRGWRPGALSPIGAGGARV